MASRARSILVAAVLGSLTACGGGGGYGDGGTAAVVDTSGTLAAPLLTNQFADLVLGQSNFTTGTGPATINATTMRPVGRGKIVGNFYYHPDLNLSGGRLLGFPLPLSNGEAATIALGAPDLTSPPVATVSDKDFKPNSVTSDGTNLVVSDSTNNRVLVYTSAPTTTYASANLVLGQANMGVNVANCTATNLSSPGSVFAVPGKLLLADLGNNRVLIWTQAISVNGQAANLVLGQANMTSCAANRGGAAGQNTLSTLGGIWTDGTMVAVTDLANRRVLIWKTFPTSNGQNADLVLGQPDFTSTGANTTASTFNNVQSVVADATHVIASDLGNNRVMIWNSIPTANGQAADVVLGQPNFTSNLAATTAQGLNGPGGVAILGGRLFVTDLFNFRVLRY